MELSQDLQLRRLKEELKVAHNNLDKCQRVYLCAVYAIEVVGLHNALALCLCSHRSSQHTRNTVPVCCDKRENLILN